MRTTIRSFCLFVTLVSCSSAHAQLAASNIRELTAGASHVCVIAVAEVIDPKWRDETGQSVLLATGTIETVVKGRDQREIVFAFKPTVSDQTHFSAGRKYLAFIYGRQRPIVMAHQAAALDINDGVLDVHQLRDEPSGQRLDAVIERMKNYVGR